MDRWDNYLPLRGRRENSFASIGKLVYGFLSGYVISKLDRLMSDFFKPSGGTLSLLPLICVSVAVVALLTTGSFTCISRSYWGRGSK